MPILASHQRRNARVCSATMKVFSTYRQVAATHSKTWQLPIWRIGVITKAQISTCSQDSALNSLQQLRRIKSSYVQMTVVPRPPHNTRTKSIRKAETIIVLTFTRSTCRRLYSTPTIPVINWTHPLACCSCQSKLTEVEQMTSMTTSMRTSTRSQAETTSVYSIIRTCRTKMRICSKLSWKILRRLSRAVDLIKYPRVHRRWRRENPRRSKDLNCRTCLLKQIKPIVTVSFPRHLIH